MNLHSELTVRVCPNPVFIIGAHRSGTTVLGRALARHSHFWTSAESLILHPLFRDLDEQLEHWLSRPSPGWLQRENVPRTEFLQALGMGVNALFSSRSQGKRWVDHTPHYGEIAGVLAEMFPGSQFIHILRDGRRVVQSMTNFGQSLKEDHRREMDQGRFLPPWSSDFATACRSWSDSVEKAVAFAEKHPGRCLTVTNEDLVENPQAGFGRILTFLGAPYESAPADFLGSNRINSSFGRSTDPVRVKELLKPWVDWTRDQQRIFREQAGETFAKVWPAAEDCDQFGPLSKSSETVRETISTLVPSGARVLVVSAGDEAIVESGDWIGWHFPRDPGGSYAGYKPATSADAIAHFESLRGQGAEFLVFPESSLWWLDFYSDFYQYLMRHYSPMSRTGSLSFVVDVRHHRGGSIVDFLKVSAARRPDHVAVEAPPDGTVTYGELDALSDRVRDRLRAMGVTKGDRVAVYMRKSIDAYAVMLGAMKAGAAYVPIDYAAPPWRSAFIASDCAVKVLAVESSLTQAWRAEAELLGPLPELFELSGVGPGAGLRTALDHADALQPAPAGADEPAGGDDLAYILYTSGSTGKPKGVMLTHTCAISHVDWCSEVFEPTERDRFSSHAPFHFDLSITDLYTPLKHGATVVLIDAERGKEPAGLARLIADRKLTIWYSTPTILAVLAEFGKMAQHDYSALRIVNFAGEVFPIKHLQAVKALLPHPRFFNLYGPTETNVCTWHPIPERIEDGRSSPYPIGKTCSHFRSRVVDEDGHDVAPGTEGELLMHGAGMLLGYYNNAARTAEAFLVDGEGRRWYHTGDLVIEGEDGVFAFAGRRDRMVKRRGYRIELGEIEAGLYRHAAVKEAAVVATKDAEGGVRIKAFIALTDGERLSEIALRAFCAKALPNYMMPDAFGFLDALPKTSTDKIDYQRLVQAH